MNNSPVSKESSKALSQKSTVELQQSLDSSLLSSLSNGIDYFNHSISQLNSLVDRVQSYVSKQLDYALESESLPFETSINILDKIQSRQIQILELIRKVYQGKPVIKNNLSYEERVVVQLFNSFSSDAEKSKFLHLVEEQLGDANLPFDKSSGSTITDVDSEEL